jgi:hypothetical protein
MKGNTIVMANEGSRFFRMPEIGLCFLSFFLNFFWEVNQTYFYTMKDDSFSTMLYGWTHCTLGDVVLTLIFFWIVSLISRSRTWVLRLTASNFISFIVLGLVYTVINERLNVYVFKSWAYNESMPLLPWLRVGLLPVLQWTVIPPIALLWVRHHLLLRQELEEIKSR